MALNHIITSAAPYLSSLFVPATPHNPTPADLVSHLDKFMKELRRVVDAVKAGGWQGPIFEVIPRLKESLLLLPHFQGIINLTKALPNPITTPDAELIHAKIALFGPLIDDTLEQSRTKRETLLALEARLPPGFAHPRVLGKDWLDGFGGKCQDLREAWAERAPASIKEQSDAVFQKVVKNFADTAELYKE